MAESSMCSLCLLYFLSFDSNHLCGQNIFIDGFKMGMGGGTQGACLSVKQYSPNSVGEIRKIWGYVMF